MANEFYTPSGTPAQNADGNSSDMRGEFTKLEQAFDKFPDLLGHANEEVVVNPTATGFTTKVAAVPVAPDSSFRNKLINGDFDISQRGITSNSTVGGISYLADKWCFVVAGGIAATRSIQPFQPSSIYAIHPVEGGPRYYHRLIIGSPAVLGSPTALAKLVQPIEGAETLQGKTVTASFWLKADAVKQISVNLTQVFGGATVSDVALTATKFTLSTTWTKYTATFNLPSVVGKTFAPNLNYLAFAFWLSAGSSYNTVTNSLGLQTGTFDIARVQLEEGSLSSNFETRPLATELALCQRTYEKSYNLDVPPGTLTSNGRTLDVTYGTSTGDHYFSQKFNAIKRIAPSVAVYRTSAANSINQLDVYVGVPYVGLATVAYEQIGQSAFSARWFNANPNAMSAISYHYTADADYQGLY